MRHRNSAVRWNRNRRRDSRHHFKRHIRRRQRLTLFTAPTEDKRIAPLQPHHPLTALSMLDQQGVDLFLRLGMLVCLFADINSLSLWAMAQKLRVGQRVINDDFRRCQ